MEGLLNFIGFILEVIGLVQWAGSKSRKERSESFRVIVLGGISGIVGIVAVQLLLVVTTFLVGGNPDGLPNRMIGEYWCLYLIAIPVGALSGGFGKALSNRIREKLDVWHVNDENFTKICVVTFGFLGSALYTMALYYMVILPTQW